MDPPVMMNGGDFGSGNTASSLCNLAEIWQYPINFGGGGNAASFALGQLAGNNDNNNSGGSSTNAYMNNGDHVSVDDPMDLEQRGNNSQSKKRREEDDSSKGISTSSPSNGNVMNDSDGKCLKMLGPKNESTELKTAADGSSAKRAENSAKLSDPLKQDYIHVRARRGQATDSHSLAERARREKISERMKILQDLVPGCNKVIGKALILDEIINYIQALQRQVEFLSMKLEAVTSRSNPNPEGFPSKDFGQQTFDMTSMPFLSQPTREFSKGSSPEWLHMQIGGSFERTT